MMYMRLTNDRYVAYFTADFARDKTLPVTKRTCKLPKALLDGPMVIESWLGHARCRARKAVRRSIQLSITPLLPRLDKLIKPRIPQHQLQLPSSLWLTKQRPSLLRNNSIATNCIVTPIVKDRFRPKASTRKTAHRRAERNLTRPRMAVARSFSLEPGNPNHREVFHCIYRDTVGTGPLSE